MTAIANHLSCFRTAINRSIHFSCTKRIGLFCCRRIQHKRQFSSFSSVDIKSVCVLKGKWVNGFYLLETINALRANVKPSVQVLSIDKIGLLTLKPAYDALVLPNGNFQQLCDELEPFQVILKNFTYKGRILGLGAGAYVLPKTSLNSQSHELKIASRRLSSVHSLGSHYVNDIDIRKIQVKDKIFDCPNWVLPWFRRKVMLPHILESTSDSMATFLSKLSVSVKLNNTEFHLESYLPAVVENRILEGGKVVLSTCHPYISEDGLKVLENHHVDENMKVKFRTLMNDPTSIKDRQELFRSMLERLDIPLK